VSAAPTAERTAGPTPTPTVSAVPAPNSNPEADALLARGDDLLVTGDVAAARLFYERAAEQGSAAAATAVGQTYDPAVLELLRVRGVRGDAQMAAQWYRKAIAAGDRQAEIRLKRLLARTPG
jgi:TPR repeat protein